jgi:hypothetical protein
MRVGIHNDEAWEINAVYNLVHNEFERVTVVNPLKLKRETAGVSCTIATVVSRTTLKHQQWVQQD